MKILDISHDEIMIWLLLGGKPTKHWQWCLQSHINRYQFHICFFSRNFIQNNISEFIHVKNYDRNTNKNQYGEYMKMGIVMMMLMRCYRMKRFWWGPLRQHEWNEREI